jgi:hypothetical protein
MGHRSSETRFPWPKGGLLALPGKRQESIVDTVDRLLLSPVHLNIDGETKRIPALEAIVSQLQLKEMAGNARASRILLRYKEFANQHAERQLQLVFVDSEYTRAISNQLPRTARD